ncbi:MAG: cation diffusion facilitator family transporter [Candidatus Sericytochromatia bacterium]|nr:cation diffusion facilitator family transporter [Candidatus Sericytochromatia bacterium]
MGTCAGPDHPHGHGHEHEPPQRHGHHHGHHHDHAGHGHDHGHHAHGHDHRHHAHGHHHLHASGRELAWAFWLSCGVLGVLLVGSARSGSLALLADAGHVVTDVAALGLSWYATRQAARPATHRRTFGHHRTGILAALANALSLLLIALWIAWEAWHRLSSPHPIEAGPMLVAATLGLLINGVIGWRLHAHAHDSLNVRSAYMHVLGDAAASAGVVVGAGLIALTGWTAIDPLLSVAIAALIAWGAWQIVDESVEILMEAVPAHLEPARIAADLAAVDGVQEVHDLHVWGIAHGLPSLSCHVLVAEADVPRAVAIVAACNQVLATRHGITHVAIQAEASRCSPDTPGCALGLATGPDGA